MTREVDTRERPRAVVLTAHWETTTEEGWITRQVAGALACVADVHVITPDGRTPGRRIDGVFTVHRLAPPIDVAAELRRDLLVEALSCTSARDGAIGADWSELIDHNLIQPWQAAGAVLADLRPDLIVIAGHHNVGALSAVEQSTWAAPVSLVALGADAHSLAFPHFDRVFDRANTVLAVTESERSSIVEFHGRKEKVHRIGAPLAANRSALSEPNTWVGDSNYILVITGSNSDEGHEDTDLSRLIRLRFPDNPVGVAHHDSFCAWHQGRLSQGWAVERSSDMARLMAWARVTVDLRPGRLFARRCVDSLLYGTPIVVPYDSRAREHAQRGGGGLWFDGAAELTWCIEALLDPTIRNAFSDQGRSYAEDEYGSTDRFIDRVTIACGLATEPQPQATA
ncbi:MAG TPA: hypothetical protein VG032_10830 [Acidimicrobiales bacterium]|nr:hypothetical protein [Acidimicrobiales bacterium]